MTARPDHLLVSLGTDKETHKANLQELAEALGIPRSSIGGLLIHISASYQTDSDYVLEMMESILFPEHRTAVLDGLVLPDGKGDSKMFTQVYDNFGYWLAEFDGKNLALALHEKGGETYNAIVSSKEEAKKLWDMGYIPQGHRYQKTAGFKERPSIN